MWDSIDVKDKNLLTWGFICCQRVYRLAADLNEFTLKIHHGVTLWMNFTRVELCNGKTNVTETFISMFDRNYLAEHLGYTKVTTEFWYKKKRKGWVPITEDAQ